MTPIPQATEDQIAATLEAAANGCDPSLLRQSLELLYRHGRADGMEEALREMSRRGEFEREAG